MAKVNQIIKKYDKFARKLRLSISKADVDASVEKYFSLSPEDKKAAWADKIIYSLEKLKLTDSQYLVLIDLNNILSTELFKDNTNENINFIEVFGPEWTP